MVTSPLVSEVVCGEESVAELSIGVVDGAEVVELTAHSAGTGILQLQLPLLFIVVVELEDEVVQSPVVSSVQNVVSIRGTAQLHGLPGVGDDPGVGLGGLGPLEAGPLLDLKESDAAVRAVLVGRHTLVLTRLGRRQLGDEQT